MYIVDLCLTASAKTAFIPVRSRNDSEEGWSLKLNFKKVKESWMASLCKLDDWLFLQIWLTYVCKGTYYSVCAVKGAKKVRMANCSRHVHCTSPKVINSTKNMINITILLKVQYSSGSWLWKLLVTLTLFTYITFSVCLVRCYSCISLYYYYFLLTSVFMFESAKKNLTSPILNPKTLHLPSQASLKQNSPAQYHTDAETPS